MAVAACIKRSHDCRTSSGSGGGGGGGGFGEDRRGSPGLEVASPDPSKKNVNGTKSGIPKPPKSSGAMEMEMKDDLEFEIAEVLSGLKQHHPHRSIIQDDLENPLRSSEEVKGMFTFVFFFFFFLIQSQTQYIFIAA